MNENITNCIDINGISSSFPPCSKSFQEIQWQDILTVSLHKPDMKQILCIKSTIEICKTRIIDTSYGKSCEGQRLTGKKCCVDGIVQNNIEYISYDKAQSVHAAEFYNLFSSFIVLAREFDCDLKFNIIPYIENIFCMQLNERDLFCSLLFTLDARPITDQISTGRVI